ncbi:hypothetical protein VUR80DRAFT_4950 [Thermomyces stellatus]
MCRPLHLPRKASRLPRTETKQRMGEPGFAEPRNTPVRIRNAGLARWPPSPAPVPGRHTAGGAPRDAHVVGAQRRPARLLASLPAGIVRLGRRHRRVPRIGPGGRCLHAGLIDVHRPGHREVRLSRRRPDASAGGTSGTAGKIGRSGSRFGRRDGDVKPHSPASKKRSTSLAPLPAPPQPDGRAGRRRLAAWQAGARQGMPDPM